jgi:hypothetical protein
MESTLSSAYKELDRAIRHKRLNASCPSAEGVKGIRQYLLREDLSEKHNRSVLKSLVTLIHDIQDAQQGLIDLAKGMKDEDAGEDGKRDSKKAIRKSDFQGDKRKGSKIRNFLGNSSTNDKDTSAPKDQTISVARKGYILGFAEKL